METHNKVWYLKRNRLFERASEGAVEHMEHFFTQVEFAKRAQLFDQGDPARMVYLLKRGKVRLSRITEDGKEITLAILGPGDIFGEEVAFHELVRSTIATCLEDSLLCMSRAEDLFSIMTEQPICALNIAKYLKEQLDDALATVEDVAYLKVGDRLIKLFERLAQEHGKPAAEGTLIDVKLTQAEIASLIGSTRETVSLEMMNLARAGRIRVQKKYVVLPKATATT